MKALKILSLSVTVMLLLLLSACGSKNDSAADTGASFSLSAALSPAASSDEAALETAAEFMEALLANNSETAAKLTADGNCFSTNASTDAGRELLSALRSRWSYSITECSAKDGNAEAVINIIGIDVEKAAALAYDRMDTILVAAAEAAQKRSDVYDDAHNFLPELLEGAYSTVSAELFDDEAVLSPFNVQLSLQYIDKQWLVSDTGSLEAAITGGGTSPDADADFIYSFASAGHPYIRKSYTLAEDSAVPGQTPNPEKFGSTKDPAVIEALINTADAQELIRGQNLSWNADISFLPDSEIRYYLDETIFMIQWQEVTAKAVGTYAEVFIADASQFRRKFVKDVFGGWDFEYATTLAKETNAVLASGGDLYNHARACGIVVYNREIYRFESESCDVCYIDTSGNLLFSKRNQFSDISEAEQFVADNDILFSICFGPVIIENGVDITPENYPWGEINDTYARAALGQLGELHYLTMNINCQLSGYYYLATLQQATDAMMAHGCPTAYALDGGQTASTIVNGKLINPVQFGEERFISDIIYFASALPPDA